MLRRKFLAALGMAPLAMPSLMRAQSAGDLQLVVPAPGGSRTGFAGRVLAAELGAVLGRPVQTFNVDTPAEAYYYLEQAPADGSVIGIVAADIATFPHRSSMYTNIASLTPLALVTTDPAGIHVRADRPYASAAQLVQAAKSQPGQMKLAGAGAIWHLSTVRWLGANGLKPADMPWANAESIGAAAGQVAGGQTDILVCSVPEMRATAAGGRLKTLALMSDRRNSRYPGIPTIGERGPRLNAGVWRGIAAPKGVSPDVAGRLTTGIRTAQASPGFRAAMARKGMMVTYADGPQFTSFAARETDAIGQAMRAAGLV